ncbi:CBO0543 family protein [Halobacillus amylolyticus]|uniref:Lycopene cyclase domain-containing protein n=1 Tax=Halobacillus amylolyticus TaxID=2932259 RepID=A0ABY4HF61_9BACI|nr:CBO0543 family protein [Halobacillus amylolyticus]UOR13509.1 hypothetical protein MUO15_08660 [Halobacillus amylolyticus]
MNDKFIILWRIHELEQKTLRIDKEKWIEYELFTWNWWLLVAFLIMPWIIWTKLIDRTRILEIVLIGLLAIIITTLLDIFVTEVEFWVYPTELIPGFPRAFAFDVSMIPVAFMLLYQYSYLGIV